MPLSWNLNSVVFVLIEQGRLLEAEILKLEERRETLWYRAYFGATSIVGKVLRDAPINFAADRVEVDHLFETVDRKHQILAELRLVIKKLTTAGRVEEFEFAD